jgi:hypothetical protein
MFLCLLEKSLHHGARRRFGNGVGAKMESATRRAGLTPECWRGERTRGRRRRRRRQRPWRRRPWRRWVG